MIPGFVSDDRKPPVPRYFQWNRGGLDGHWMMPCDDTRGNIWTIAGAW